MNNWNFTGNLGNDAESRFSPSGDAIVSFSVGVKAGYGDKASTTWARCTMFGKRGEAVAQYLTKGQLVGIAGELNAREWVDKEGLKRTSIEVRVSDLTLLGKRDGQQEQRQATPRPQQARPAAQQAQSTDDLDEIPF